MLRLALAFEGLLLLRSKTRILALVAFLAIGSLALINGHQYVAQWEAALASGTRAQARSIDEAHSYFVANQQGPSDRPWVDLSQPLWQDWYAGTRVGRTPRVFAGLAAGAVDPAPAVFRVNRLADPLAISGYRIENPELAAGAFDMVIVLALLLPLLVGVFGLEIGSQEREQRLDRLIIVHSGTVRRWLAARMLAIAFIAGGAATVLCLTAGILNGAGAGETAGLVALALTYTLLWSGLLLALNARARTVRGAAFTFGVLWTLLCVLLPALTAEIALGRVHADYAVTETLQVRSLRHDAYEQDTASVLLKLYARYPRLTELPAAADEVPDPLVTRHAYDAMMVQTLADRHADMLRKEASGTAIAQAVAWLSPAIALSLTLERMAGVGPEPAAAYRAYLVAAVEERVDWVLKQAWAKTPLTEEDFNALVEEVPPPYQASSTGFINPLLALLIWAMASWLAALARLSDT